LSDRKGTILNLWDGILLGVIQGLTEFLPVSSSGHLVIVQSFMEFQQPGVVFDVMLHFGTLLAVLVFFRKEILDILISLIPVGWFRNTKRGQDPMQVRSGRKMALYIITGTVFTGVIGLSFEERIHDLFTSATTVSFMLLITGLLLFMSDRFHDGRRVEKDMNIIDSVVIGIVQGISLIPGISRSGSTIAFGIFRGLDGQTAARFSFLLSIPAILGAVVLESKYIGMIPPGDIAVYFTGMVVAAVTGFLTLKLLLFIISKHKLSIFAYYCWILGISTLIIKAI